MAQKCHASLVLIHRFPLSLLFHNHRSLPVPICGYHLQTLLTLPWLPFFPSHYPSFHHQHSFPPSPHSFYICPYSCYTGLYCTISRLYCPRQRLWRSHNPRLYSWHAWHNNNSVELLVASWGNLYHQCQAELEHDTLATPRFRYRCSAMLTLGMKKTTVTLSHIHTKIRQIWRTTDVEQCGFKPCRC